jgi:hypothetical protein
VPTDDLDRNTTEFGMAVWMVDTCGHPWRAGCLRDEKLKDLLSKDVQAGKLLLDMSVHIF